MYFMEQRNQQKHNKTIDNKKDNTLGKDTIGKEVLQSIDSVHDKTLDNVLEATIHITRLNYHVKNANLRHYK